MLRMILMFFMVDVILSPNNRFMKRYRSYFGEPIGKHAAGAGRIPTLPYVMPSALRYRIRADVLRPARSVCWDGSTLTTEEVTEDDTASA